MRPRIRRRITGSRWLKTLDSRRAAHPAAEGSLIGASQRVGLWTLDFGLWTLDSLIVAGLFWAATACGAENWPQFRGPEGNGHSDAKGLPLSWSETNHIKWKT